MNASKLLFIASFIAIAFPALSHFFGSDVPTGMKAVFYVTDFLSMQLKFTVLAMVLFYSHKTAEKNMW